MAFGRKIDLSFYGIGSRRKQLGRDRPPRFELRQGPDGAGLVTAELAIGGSVCGRRLELGLQLELTILHEVKLCLSIAFTSFNSIFLEVVDG